ncbi:MAG: 1-acyl-sn-glycerol-3-phosphate acyltransferase [Calditrichales bacterium]|nr:1-acyl-sn-glycerol-3-phosphate acyltransferase [Calditrichales bacterium]
MICYKYILTKVLGWKIKGDFPNLNKSVIIFAPHTSYWDAFFGKLYLKNIGVKHKFLSKKELFIFPFHVLMYAYGSIPVSSGRNFILQISEIFNSNKEIHIVLSPEGTRRKVNKWKKGFYYMAKEANVPIVIGYIDYKKKEIGIKGVIHETENIKSVIREINGYYQNVGAKHPERFSLNIADKINHKSD